MLHELSLIIECICLFKIIITQDFASDFDIAATSDLEIVAGIRDFQLRMK